MRRPLTATHLGATLYVPATRDDMLSVAIGARHPELRSVVFCLEDSVRAEHVPCAMAQLRTLLGQLRIARPSHPDGPALFVRPRDADMLWKIGGLPGAEMLDGFVLPKITADSLPDYLAGLGHAAHYIMPTVETREAFDHGAMLRLRDQLATIYDRVLCVRIGGNDLLATFAARRSATRTAYEGPLGHAIASLVATFVPWGFAMSAPVLECYGDAALLRDEVARDLDHGLVTKTAIHPSQVAIIHDAYRVDTADFDNAREILAADAAAVFARDGVMSEPATHRRWAAAIIDRAAVFGMRGVDAAALTLVSA